MSRVGRPPRKFYAGIDLHGTNNVVVIRDGAGATVASERLPNALGSVTAFLARYRDRTVAVAIESTYNGYWLIDGLIEAGYDVRMAHPPGLEKHRDTKYADDLSDAILLADLLRDGRLPEGHIYPKEQRGLRDLLRRRMLLVEHQTSLLLSLQSLYARHRGRMIEVQDFKRMDVAFFEQWIIDPFVKAQLRALFKTLRRVQEAIADLEREAAQALKPDPDFQRMITAPGIGNILGAVIRMETGDIARFASVGDFVSYCRLAPSVHLSNGKKKGEGNAKCGNRYLGWAFLEAAHKCRRYCEPAKRYFERKKAKRGTVIASKALAAKLARSVDVMLKHGCDFDVHRAFGPSAGAEKKARQGSAALTASV